MRQIHQKVNDFSESQEKFGIVSKYLWQDGFGRLARQAGSNAVRNILKPAFHRGKSPAEFACRKRVRLSRGVLRQVLQQFARQRDNPVRGL